MGIFIFEKAVDYHNNKNISVMLMTAKVFSLEKFTFMCISCVQKLISSSRMIALLPGLYNTEEKGPLSFRLFGFSTPKHPCTSWTDQHTHSFSDSILTQLLMDTNATYPCS